MTASPEQLQLMLYDGAIRFANQGREAIEAKNYEEAFEKLTRAQKIVLEMDRGLNHEVSPELCGRMSALYMFCYRKLVDGCVLHDVNAIDEAIEILKIERQTWKMLIEKLNKEIGSDSHSSDASDEGGSLSIEG